MNNEMAVSFSSGKTFTQAVNRDLDVGLSFLFLLKYLSGQNVCCGLSILYFYPPLFKQLTYGWKSPLWSPGMSLLKQLGSKAEMVQEPSQTWFNSRTFYKLVCLIIPPTNSD